MRSYRTLSVLWLLVLHTTGAVALPPLSVQSETQRLTFLSGESAICTYDYSGQEIPRPFFANLQLADGRRVTRNHPPRPGQDDLDHGTAGNYFHPGVWLAFSDFNGGDYWRLKARVEHEGFAIAPQATANEVTFTVRNSYRDQQEPSRLIAEEFCRYALIRRSDGYLLVCDSVFRSVMDPLVFGDQEEMGLGIRVAKPLAVKHGGQMADSQGRTTPQEIWGQEAAWCECRGQLEGKTVGVMLLADPANSFASRWHARDYGLITANPFGHKVFGDDPARRTEVPTSQQLRLRYALIWREIGDGSAIPAKMAAESSSLMGRLPRPQFTLNE